MDKRIYNKPEVTIVKLAYQTALLSGSLGEPGSEPSQEENGGANTARGAAFSDFEIEE